MRPNAIDAADIPDSLLGFVKVTSQRRRRPEQQRKNGKKEAEGGVSGAPQTKCHSGLATPRRTAATSAAVLFLPRLSRHLPSAAVGSARRITAFFSSVFSFFFFFFRNHHEGRGERAELVIGAPALRIRGR